MYSPPEPPQAVTSPFYAALALLLFCLFNPYPAVVSSAADQDIILPDYPVMPSKYGEIIYRINEKSPKQLYIIGISHRDPGNGVNDGNTVQTQAEIFRIGEWLNRNLNLELLLPEGYFVEKKDYSPALTPMEEAGDDLPVSLLNNVLLLEKLADETRFVNAEMLLMEQFNMPASQVEDRKIYNAVYQCLGELREKRFERLPPAEMIVELEYLQDIRTAALLQKIPEVIEDELQNRTIRNPSALFTIGLNHIQDILHYLEKNKILIDALPHDLNHLQNYRDAELNLLTSGYGVTIIIPRTLADNRGLLQMTNLDRILLADGGESVQPLIPDP